MFSLGIDPSTTNTYGASSLPSAASRNGFMNSSPPSVGESTLLCRCTFGRPGTAPSRTSSMLGSDAAVTETVSPSQLSPSDVHRMWTSSTPAASALTSASTRCQCFLCLLELERVDEQLVSAPNLDVQRPARAAQRRERHEPCRGIAAIADRLCRDVLDGQLGAVERRAGGDQVPGEQQRRGHALAQVADADLDLPDAAPVRMSLRDRPDCVGYRELVHAAPQQILGSGSPTSWSITRLPPNAVSTSTMFGGSVLTSPISAARSQPGTAWSAASAASAASGATKATNLPSLATYIGSMPRISAAPATAGFIGTSPSRTIIATCDARASSFSTEATPPRVASRMQRSCLPAALRSASAAGQRERVSDSTSASSSNSL